jgi:cytochrome c oxidase assembly protein subunit 15
MPNSEKTYFFRKLLWILLGYTLLVILWGAWVRISFSGDGCGDSWPLCDGKLIPKERDGKTWIEFGHRLMSGAFGIYVFIVWAWGRKLFQKTHRARLYGFLTLFFTVTEALLGAKLVIFGLVTDNDSPWRAFSMGAHMFNSLLLVGSITVWLESLNPVRVPPQEELIKNLGYQLKWSIHKFIPATVFLFIAVAITGSVAALSSTLFPSQSLLDGLLQELDPNAHYLVRLRGLHPLTATLVGGGLALIAWVIGQSVRDAELKSRSMRLALLTGVGVVFGMLTLFLLYPIWMKLTHLLIAHLIWIHLLLWLVSLKQAFSKTS